MEPSSYDAWKTSGPPEPTAEETRHAELLDALNERADEAAEIVENQDEIGVGITSIVRDDESGPMWKLQIEIVQPIDDADDMICLSLDLAKAVRVFADAIHDY